MAIDYIIEYGCVPQRELGIDGILDRLKERARAAEVIEWFRAAGDQRSPAEMGFEFSQSFHGERNEKQLVVVQDLLDHAADLDAHQSHCLHCPANRAGKPYGCAGFVPYPVTARAETWLLERLPVPDEPLIWLLLKQGIQKLGYDGASLRALREADGETGERAYFELPIAPRRRLGELRVSGDQMLEMIFGVGEWILPNHAGILLLFTGAIDRDLEADEIQRISSVQSTESDAKQEREDTTFQLSLPPDADHCSRELQAFLHSLYFAWKLRARLYLDA